MSKYFQEKALPLREIIKRLEKVYCGSIGAEFMHIFNLEEVKYPKGQSVGRTTFHAALLKIK